MSTQALALSGILSAILLAIGIRDLSYYWTALRLRRRAERRMGWLR